LLRPNERETLDAAGAVEMEVALDAAGAVALDAADEEVVEVVVGVATHKEPTPPITTEM
jgi:hypothetical protein